MKTQMIMSKVKIKSLLLLTYLAMGIPSLHAAETLQVWIRASNDSKNIYKKKLTRLRKNRYQNWIFQCHDWFWTTSGTGCCGQRATRSDFQRCRGYWSVCAARDCRTDWTKILLAERTSSIPPEKVPNILMENITGSHLRSNLCLICSQRLAGKVGLRTTEELARH